MLAIVSAMPEEIALVVAALSRSETRELGRRVFHAGTFHGVEAVVVFSRMGKVAAAATITQLIASYPVSRLVFSGVAGGVRSDLAIGDIVVASSLIQHDMDASPIFPRYEVPLLGQARFEADADIRERLLAAAREFLAHDLGACVVAHELDFFGVSSPKASVGVVASGDKFFASAAEVDELRRRLPETACVEMEGAAAAQVCTEYGIPFGVIRTISDSANESSVHDFPRFAREIARHYSAGALERFSRAL
ncbi:MAG TPA: 5'-methylthioadenosine/adenosylhomocysteine nucleosidase [Steroidobacteraceae bacterium]|nr:5'-methylthioadenosine/adenosylhomocysteine nucleosidase [Steroidobacteraceae bacterium]